MLETGNRGGRSGGRYFAPCQSWAVRLANALEGVERQLEIVGLELSFSGLRQHRQAVE